MTDTAPDAPQNFTVQGVAHEGITVHTSDGRRARLAVIDDDGNILDVGRAVERAVFIASREVIYNLWKAQGHMRVFFPPK